MFFCLWVPSTGLTEFTQQSQRGTRSPPIVGIDVLRHAPRCLCSASSTSRASQLAISGVPSVSGWRATMVNDVDVLVEELGFVCACRTRRDTHDGHDDGHDDAQLLTNQVRQIRASSPRRAVLRLQEERLRLLTPTEQRGCDDPDDIGCLWSASSLCDISSTSQPDKISPLSTLIPYPLSPTPDQY